MLRTCTFIHQHVQLSNIVDVFKVRKMSDPGPSILREPGLSATRTARKGSLTREEAAARSNQSQTAQTACEIERPLRTPPPRPQRRVLPLFSLANHKKKGRRPHLAKQVITVPSPPFGRAVRLFLGGSYCHSRHAIATQHSALLLLNKHGCIWCLREDAL